MIRVPVAHGDRNLGTPVCVLVDAQPDIAYEGTLTFGHVGAEVDQLQPTIIVIDIECVVGQVLSIANELHARVPTCALMLLWLFQSSPDSVALRCAWEPVPVISGVYR
jgi:hypothetical protein